MNQIGEIKLTNFSNMALADGAMQLSRARILGYQVKVICLGIVALAGATVITAGIATYFFRKQFFENTTPGQVDQDLTERNVSVAPRVVSVEEPKSLPKEITTTFNLSDALSDKIFKSIFPLELPKSSAVRVNSSGALLIPFGHANPPKEWLSFHQRECTFDGGDLLIPNEKIHLFLSPSLYKEIIEEIPDLKLFFSALFTGSLSDKFNCVIDSFLWTNEGEALSALGKEGQREGTYALCRNERSGGKYNIYVLDRKRKVQQFELLNPYVWHGTYDALLHRLQYPLLPNADDTVHNRTIVHNTLSHWKHVWFLESSGFCQQIDSFNRLFHNSHWVGCQRQLTAWLSFLPEKRTFPIPYFLKIFAHHLGIKGSFLKVDLEGFSGNAAMLELLDNTLAFLSSPESNEIKEKELLCRMCTSAIDYHSLDDDREASIEAMLKDLQEKIPTTFSTGWQGHAINITLSNNYLVLTNKGDRDKDRQGGMGIYKINQPITKEKLNKIRFFDGNRESFQKILSDEFGLEFIHFVKRNDQIVGNCTFSSNKSLLRAALIIIECDKSDIISREKIEKISTDCHKLFTGFTRMQQIKQFLTLLEKIKFNASEENDVLTLLLFAMIKFSIPKAERDEIHKRLVNIRESRNDQKLIPLLIELNTIEKTDLCGHPIWQTIYEVIDPGHREQLVMILYKKKFLRGFDH